MKHFIYSFLMLWWALRGPAQGLPEGAEDFVAAIAAADIGNMMLMVGPNWNETVVVGNAFDTGEGGRLATPPLFEAKYGIFSKMHGPDRLPWQEADQIIQGHFDAVLGESSHFTEAEIKYTASLQSLSTRFLKFYLVKEPPSQQLSERIHFYLEVLYRHQGKTLYVMADALVHAKPYMRRKDYRKYRDYILEETATNLQEVESKWDAYYEKHKVSEGMEQSRYLYYGKRLLNMAQEADYVRDRLGSE